MKLGRTPMVYNQPRVLPWFTLFFAAGIIVSRHLQMDMSVSLFLTAIFMLSGSFFLIKGDLKFFVLIMLLFFLAFGTFWGAYYHMRGKELLNMGGTVQSVTAMIAKREEYHFGKIYRLTDVTIKGQKFQGDISGIVYDAKEKLRYGDVIQFRGKLETPPAPRNPGEFNLKNYLLSQGVVLQTELNEKNIKRITRRGNPLLITIYNWRDMFITQVDKFMKPREASVFKAVLLGNKRELSPSDRELFTNFGLMHLLAVSGLHVGFVLMFVLGVTRVLKMNRLWELVLSTVTLFFFMAITGFAPPVVRAGIMAIVYLIAGFLGRKHRIEEALALSALLILFFNPLQLFSASFQMTFAAVMGLIYLSPLMERLFCGLLLIPFSAFLAVTPLVAHYYSTVSLAGPFSSILAAPIAGITLIIGLISMVASFILPFLSQQLLHLCGALLYFLMEILRLGGELLPLSALNVQSPGVAYLAVIYLVFTACFIIYRNRETPRLLLAFKRYGRVLFLTVLLVMVFFFLCYHKEPVLRVIFLDVGQGDAIFIETPAGKHILIDGGPRTKYRDAGDKVVLPYLYYRGIGRLDAVINTHPDNDHLGGLLTVVRDTRPRLLILPEMKELDEYKALMDLVNKRKVALYFVSEGDSLRLDKSVEIKFLHPPPQSNFSDNDSSLVTKITYGTTDILLTGDIEREGQDILLKKYKLNAEIFQYPHHGSNGCFNPRLLDKVQPEMAVISVGRENRYGHPGDKVIKWANEKGVTLYRTDKHGAITIESNGQDIDVQTVLEPTA